MSINLIEYIGVIGFHHSLGHRIEFLYPDLDEESKKQYNWNLLPFYGIADGVHNSFEDYTFFIMEEINPTTSPSKRLYGLSYFKQKNKRDLPKQAITPEDTRSSIQKSVIILSKFPIFNSFKTQLSSATICYFNQGDFQNTDLLVTWFHAQNNEFKERNNEKLVISNSFGYQMNQVLENNNNNHNNHKKSIPINSDFLFGSMSLKKLIMHFGRNSLVFFKLIMLERGVVVFCPQPVSPVSEAIMSVLSLHSKSYDLLFSTNQSISNDFQIDWTTSTSEEMVLNQLGLPIPLFNDGRDNNTTNSDGEKVYGSSGMILQPYLPLQQISSLLPPQQGSGKTFNGFLVGTSNSLFLKNPPSTVHAIVDIQNGEIQFKDESLNRIMELTSSDRRFIDNVYDKVELYNRNNNSSNGNSNNSDNDNTIYKEGCDKWIRDQFENYIVCLLSSICRFIKIEDGKNVLTNMDQLAQYNDSWIRRWTTTKNFYLWRKQMFQNLPLPQLNYPVHPSGPPSDMLDKFQDKLTTSIKDLQPLTNQFSQLFSFTSTFLRNQINNNNNNNNNNNFENIDDDNGEQQKQQIYNTHILKSSYSQEFFSSGDGINSTNTTWSKVQENGIIAATKAVSAVKPFVNSSKTMARQFSNQLMNYIAPHPSSEIPQLNQNDQDNSIFESQVNEYDFIGNYYSNNNNNNNNNNNGDNNNNSNNNNNNNNDNNDNNTNNTNSNNNNNNSNDNGTYTIAPTTATSTTTKSSSTKIVGIISTSNDDNNDESINGISNEKKSYQLPSDTRDDAYEL
ncbi:hypothetical protein ACTFIZ_000664 [Dictyostelium cf. discoideum]